MSLLTNSLLLVLREVLEASVLFGLLWNYIKFQKLHLPWLWLVVPLSLVFSVLYALNLQVITELWDGSGQERITATLNLLIYISVLGLLWRARGPISPLFVMMLISTALIAAAVREGSEVIIYMGAFFGTGHQQTAVFLGGLIGAGIGVSAGVLVSAFIHNLTESTARLIVGVALIAIASGMMLQGLILLDQVGLLPYSEKAYSLEWLVSEQSVLGQLLYAVIGYDSEPTKLQVAFYGLCFMIACLALAGPRINRRTLHEVD